ncbi:MAG TPA: flagellar motor switch protein FliN [Bryobacteraceae bacterium]|nr:flagellar motor switch protein FliN [Bryobacteraceae bacterium]
MNERSFPGAATAPALDILLDIELPVTLRFGRRQMSLDEILRLDTGSMVEFDRNVEDPVEVLVNDKVVARGEAVTVHGHYGVRILEIAGAREHPQPAAKPGDPA